MDISDHFQCATPSETVILLFIVASGKCNVKFKCTVYFYGVDSERGSTVLLNHNCTGSLRPMIHKIGKGDIVAGYGSTVNI